MAAFDNSPWVGDRAVRPTDAELAAIEAMDSALEAIGVALLWRHAGLFMVPLHVYAVPDDETKYSVAYEIQVPCKLVDAWVGIEVTTALGAEALIQLKLVSAGGIPLWVSANLGDPIDVFEDQGDLIRHPIDDSLVDLNPTDLVRLSITGIDAGEVFGGQAQLVLFRR